MAKHLPPAENPDIPADFKEEIEKEAEAQVERYTTYAVTVLSSVPERVALRIKSIRMDWALLSLALATAPNPGSGEPQP